jgi:glutamate/tyrosine decarboxylase-like PLP-dependent enzyme
LRWISNLANFPKESGGVFVQGGTIGNLSALVVAREHARNKYKDNKKWVIICSNQSHSSIVSAAKIMDVEVFLAEPNNEGKLTGEIVLNALNDVEKDLEKKVFAIVATPGTTNLGIIDELESIGKIANEKNIWYHVDGAYGLAALCAPSVRVKFNGIELADSLIVDPHKWLFAPFDACALIYKDPKLAKETHMQKASYLETLHDDSWNPSDYAINLTRRTRGLPFWFSLSAYGTDAYSEAMEQTLTVAKQASELVKQHPNLTLLMEPELSIVAFERNGWQKSDYEKWSEKLLQDQIGFIPPSSHKGKPILRFAIVNPWTKIEDIKIILDTL